MIGICSCRWIRVRKSREKGSKEQAWWEKQEADSSHLNWHGTESEWKWREAFNLKACSRGHASSALAAPSKLFQMVPLTLDQVFKRLRL